MTDCPFCKIVNEELHAQVVHEDRRTLAIMDINPVADGHVLVLSRRHAPDLYTIEAEDLSAVTTAAQRIAAAIMRAVKPTGINLFQANGPGAGQTVRHFHMHIVPRREGDGLPMSWTHVPGDPQQIAEVAEEIRRHL